MQRESVYILILRMIVASFCGFLLYKKFQILEETRLAESF